MTTNRTPRRTALIGAALLMLPAAVTTAGAPQTWPFDLETSGEDVTWTSPTAVAPGAAAYATTLELTLVEATVLVFGFPVDIDVTDMIPAELQTATGCGPGPAPLTIFDQPFVFPDPPEPVALAASVTVGLDAAGFAFASATDVAFGSYDFGAGSVPIVGLRLAGNLTAEAIGDATCPADLDENGAVGFSDLLQALTEYGPCDCCRADLDFDGNVAFDDLLAILTAWGPCP